MFVKVRIFAGKRFAGVAKVDLFFLVAGSNTAGFKELALLVAASPAVPGREEVEHLLEIRIFFKYRLIQKGFKPFGINIKISQFFLELPAVFPDLPIHMGKAGFTTQTARCDRFFDSFISHTRTPFSMNYFETQSQVPWTWLLTLYILLEFYFRKWHKCQYRMVKAANG